MGKTLFIAEKPSAGRDIAAALPENLSRQKSVDGDWLEGDNYMVCWAVGHLLSLAPPEKYAERYEKWRIEDLPIIPDVFLLQTNKGMSKQLRLLKKLMTSKDVDIVVNACDAGREGELIFRLIADKVGMKKTTKRLWLASMTEGAIRTALVSLAPLSDYDALADAAHSRSQADWLVGMNASRAATLMLRPHVGGAVSLGRVQTPTLAILVRREHEITGFVPEQYWLVNANFTCKTGEAREYVGSYGNEKRLTSADAADKIVAACKGQAGRISAITTLEKSEKAPLLYDLTSLQREAGTCFGWTAKKTLATTQRLYEVHKVVTYPRTDSRYIPADQQPHMERVLGLLQAYGMYEKAAEQASADPCWNNIVNDKKVTDHFAIIPTEKIGRIPSGMDVDEKKLLDMICRRSIAALLPAARVESTVITTLITDAAAEDHSFTTKGRRELFAGWRSIYEGASWFKRDESLVPSLTEGEAVITKKIVAVEKTTQPPKRYSDSTLLGMMETAGKLVEEDEARQAMKESGLGTPATRAAIIERLIDVGYVARAKKALQPTDKGIRVIDLLANHVLTQPDLTGEWESRLENIRERSDNAVAFMGDIKAFTDSTVKTLIGLDLPPAPPRDPKSFPPAKVLAPCPSCGKPLQENRKAFSCWSRDDAGCGYVIWKTAFGKTLPMANLQELATTGITAKAIEGLKSKAGKVFSAQLKMEKQEEKWKCIPLFAPREESKPNPAKSRNSSDGKAVKSSEKSSVYPVQKSYDDGPPPYDPFA